MLRGKAREPPREFHRFPGSPLTLAKPLITTQVLSAIVSYYVGTWLVVVLPEHGCDRLCGGGINDA